jgi:hypothetical protein
VAHLLQPGEEFFSAFILGPEVAPKFSRVYDRLDALFRRQLFKALGLQKKRIDGHDVLLPVLPNSAGAVTRGILRGAWLAWFWGHHGTQPPPPIVSP